MKTIRIDKKPEPGVVGPKRADAGPTSGLRAGNAGWRPVWVVIVGTLWGGVVGSVRADEVAAETGPKAKVHTVIGALASTKDSGTEEGFTGSVGGTMTRALKQADEAIAKAAEVGRRIAFRFTDGRGPRTFVLPGAAMNPETADALSEDLAVMSRILEKATGRGTDEPWAILGGRRGGVGWELDAFYLDGFGALFLTRVDFPLLAPAEKSGDKPEENKDRVWEEARRELQGERHPPDGRLFFTDLAAEPPGFDPKRVEDLKRAVLRALEHASNLRGIPATESVVVSIFGPASTGPRRAAFTADGKKLALSSGDGTVRLWNLQTGDAVPEPRAKSSVMTFRVTKKEVDDLASGKLDEEGFAAKVQVGVR